MLYVPRYVGADLGKMPADFLGHAGATGVMLAPLVVLGLGAKAGQTLLKNKRLKHKVGRKRTFISRKRLFRR